MAHAKESRYVCGTCGATSLRWEGQCRSCNGWNTLVENVVERPRVAAAARRKQTAFPAVVALNDVTAHDSERLVIGLREVDRVLGGGLVPGSLVLLGGEPGIGKSTLVLAVCGRVADEAGA